MKCTDYHDLWQRRLDGLLHDDSPAEAEHLRSCPSCAALERAASCFGPSLRGLPAPAVPAALQGRIVQAVLKDRRQRLQRQRWLRLASLAAAACLLFLLGAILGPRPSGKQLLAGKDTNSGAAPTPTVDESVQEMGSVVASVTSRTADATVSQTRLLLPPMPPADLGEMKVTASLPPSAQSLREAGENISAGLAPVRQSARRAVELFLRELPVDNIKQSES